MLSRECVSRTLIPVTGRAPAHKNPHLSLASGYRATLVSPVHGPRGFLVALIINRMKALAWQYLNTASKLLKTSKQFDRQFVQ
jgi:hypothetical protein